MSYVVKDGMVLNEEFTFSNTDLEIAQGKITKIGKLDAPYEVIDAKDLYVIPGLIDIHTHGCAGCDFCDGEIDSLKTISHYLGKNGITSYLGTSMTLAEESLIKIFNVANEYMQGNHLGAYLHGIHMEGPFFSKDKKGAQPKEHLRNPDIELFKRLNRACGGHIKVCSMAPELEGAHEFISFVKEKAVISLAHTAANYEIAIKAVNMGAKSFTHLYNAMTPYTHRSPGVVGAAFDSDSFVELISDGIHVHPAAIRSTFKLKGDDRVVLVSDSMSACGMKDGTYELGGQLVKVQSGAATLEDGTIAGSTTNLMDCVKTCVDFGVPLEKAIKAATSNPAKLIGVDDITGSISIGKNADLVLLDKELKIKGVFIKGERYL